MVWCHSMFAVRTYFIWHFYGDLRYQDATNFKFFRGSAPDPTGELAGLEDTVWVLENTGFCLCKSANVLENSVLMSVRTVKDACWYACSQPFSFAFVTASFLWCRSQLFCMCKMHFILSICMFTLMHFILRMLFSFFSGWNLLSYSTFYTIYISQLT